LYSSTMGLSDSRGTALDVMVSSDFLAMITSLELLNDVSQMNLLCPRNLPFSYYCLLQSLKEFGAIMDRFDLIVIGFCAGIHVASQAVKMGWDRMWLW